VSVFLHEASDAGLAYIWRLCWG